MTAAAGAQARRSVIAVALAEIALGLAALLNTLAHAALYPSRAQLLVEVAIASGVALAGCGLLRGRRWALRVSLALCYLSFLVVVLLIGIAFERTPTPWWAWLLPLALPALGVLVHGLRRATPR